MLLAERTQFEAQLAELCAGFNVPMTDERREAFWRGFQNAALPTFARTVEYALGEHGPEKFPSTKMLWGLYRNCQRQRRTSHEAPAQPDVSLDNFTAFANRRLRDYLSGRGAVTDASLAKMVALKNKLAADYRLIDTEDPITEIELKTALHRAWDAVFVERTEQEVERDRDDFCRVNGLQRLPARYR